MKLSIIVPIYNAEMYLNRCLDSLEKIQYADMEILCIDDGSSDSSRDICVSYTVRDKRFKIISQSNAGLPAARNKGLKEARGEYISFVDSDDWIDPGMLPDFVCKMDADQTIDICISDAVRSYPDGSKERMFQIEPERLLAAEEALGEMVSNRIFFWYMWGKVYRRKVFEGFMADETVTTSEDLDSNWQLFENRKIRNVLYSPRYQYYYFMNPISMTEGMDLLERRKSDFRVYMKVLNTRISMQADDIVYQMNLYALRAIYDILRDLCYRNAKREDLDHYVVKGREIITAMKRIRTMDVGYINKMKNLTEDARRAQEYFSDVFRSVEKILESIGDDQDVYIYGTGIVARYVSEMLEKIGYYDGHVISEDMPNILRFRGKPVYYASQVSEECTLLLAMNRTNQNMVLKNLNGRKRVIELPIPDHF